MLGLERFADAADGSVTSLLSSYDSPKRLVERRQRPRDERDARDGVGSRLDRPTRI